MRGQKQRRVVMIGDDEPRLAELIAGLLEQRGFSTITAESVGDVMASIEQGGALDVVLLDVNLTDGTAKDVLDRMSERQLNVPVILTSGYTAEDVPSDLSLHPAVIGYLAKPYPIDELVALIERQIENGSGHNKVAG